MHRPIAVVDGDEKNCLELCSALERESYRTCSLNTLSNLEAVIEEGECWLTILDLDNLSVDNRFFQKIKKKNPALIIITLSSRWYHPELAEAMSTHIYACLGKPVNEEELIFILKSRCGGS